MTTKTATIASLSHRLTTEPPTTPLEFYDCINPALERAAAIADLMEVALQLNMGNDLKNSWRAAQAIRFEVLDAQAMLDAYIDNVNITREVSLPDSQGGE